MSEMEKDVKVTSKVTCAFPTSASGFHVSKLWLLCLQPLGVGTGQLHRHGTPWALPSEDTRLGTLFLGDSGGPGFYLRS